MLVLRRFDLGSVAAPFERRSSTAARDRISTMASVKVAVLVFISAMWFAGAALADVTVRPGVESRVGFVYDCGMKTHAPAVWGRADNGTVTIREIDGPACNEKSMKLAGIFYKSNPGFVGDDKVYMIGYLTDGGIDTVIHVEVSKKKGQASLQKDRVPKQ
jgi:hypothetical protein